MLAGEWIEVIYRSFNVTECHDQQSCRDLSDKEYEEKYAERQ